MKIWVLLLISLPLAGQDKHHLDSLLSAARTETAQLVAEYDRISETYDSAVEAKSSVQLLDSLQQQMSVIQNGLRKYDHRPEEIRIGFIRSYPNAGESAVQLSYFVHALPLDSLQQLYNDLSSANKQSKEGKYVATEIAIRQSTAVNNPAPDFTATDINGKPLRLSKFKGQFVLLDFWASWCVPCRESNPHLIELYNKHHSKGFTIISIADDKEPAWRKAVAKDNVGIWHHVRRGNDLNNAFAVYTLPVKILLDRKGKIIGRFTGSDDKELEEMLIHIQ